MHLSYVAADLQPSTDGTAVNTREINRYFPIAVNHAVEEIHKCPADDVNRSLGLCRYTRGGYGICLWEEPTTPGKSIPKKIHIT